MKIRSGKVKAFHRVWPTFLTEEQGKKTLAQLHTGLGQGKRCWGDSWRRRNGPYFSLGKIKVAEKRMRNIIKRGDRGGANECFVEKRGVRTTPLCVDQGIDSHDPQNRKKTSN